MISAACNPDPERGNLQIKSNGYKKVTKSIDKCYILCYYIAVIFHADQEGLIPMKKILAVMLALVMAYSCMSLAFAADFSFDKAKFSKMSASDVVDKLVDVFNNDADIWSAVKDTVIRIIDFIENIGVGAASKADVAGAISDLESKLETLPILGDILEYCHNLINTLKQKIKDLYAGNRETEAVVCTDVAPSADTGSSSAGIAAFAAVSVAAAAAYVCTRKKVA